MEESRVLSVLVVDDEETTRWGLARLLRRSGYRADEAADGREALSKLSMCAYDVVITDLMMPRLAGVDFIREIKETYAGRVIVMTAYGTPESYLEALDYGAVDCLNKPIVYENLLAIIESIARTEPREPGRMP